MNPPPLKAYPKSSPPRRTGHIPNLWLQCYSKDSLINEFEENGFKVEELYSDVAGKAFDSESAEIAIVAKKS